VKTRLKSQSRSYNNNKFYSPEINNILKKTSKWTKLLVGYQRANWLSVLVAWYMHISICIYKVVQLHKTLKWVSCTQPSCKFPTVYVCQKQGRSQAWLRGPKPPKQSSAHCVIWATSNEINERMRRPFPRCYTQQKNAKKPLRGMRAACHGLNAAVIVSRSATVRSEGKRMREEKGRRRKEKENDSKGRSRRGRKGRRYASGLKPPKTKMLATSLAKNYENRLT